MLGRFQRISFASFLFAVSFVFEMSTTSPVLFVEFAARKASMVHMLPKKATHLCAARIASASWGRESSKRGRSKTWISDAALSQACAPHFVAEAKYLFLATASLMVLWSRIKICEDGA